MVGELNEDQAVDEIVTGCANINASRIYIHIHQH